MLLLHSIDTVCSSVERIENMHADVETILKNPNQAELELSQQIHARQTSSVLTLTISSPSNAASYH